ncbi:cell wall-associated NlpC family hydrolase [Pseudomonas nitritireducens]|uniref:Cell wall-associated NlpC family hydrolase n=1 Tax=Pseudomonas nitroreducens TaxID=46680 RepID=A0A7W7KR06_PSENT|nr:C40 family peptidase [Pseudomonas nitritireducens]MBB4866658.1 cell wall-associated NlpC family hydrolase [Pseudomonas nitritireducens]
MRPLILLSTALLLGFAMAPAEARETRSSAPHQASAKLSRAAQGKIVNRNVVRQHLGARRAAQAGLHRGKASSNSRVVARAHELIGIPYRFGGSSVASGFDCSGLLVYLFRTEAGMKVPRTTGEMIENGGARVGRHELRPGDAVFFNRNGRGATSHVGLYVGNNQFIHAPSSGETIRLDSLTNSYWQRSFTTARRFSG